MKIKRLIQIGNQAKDSDCYPVANAAFALAANNYFEGIETDGVAFELETNDPDGMDQLLEAYYDLIHIRIDNQSLCIPVPILTIECAITAVKSAKRIKREEHKRTKSDAATEKQLWEKLSEFYDSDLENMIDQILTGHANSATKEGWKQHLPKPERGKMTNEQEFIDMSEVADLVEKTHSYTRWDCEKCGKEMCWDCAVKCLDDGTGEGPITCPHCGADGGYYE